MNKLKSVIIGLVSKYRNILVVIGLIIILFLITLASQFTYDLFITAQPETESYANTGYEDCNVIGIELRGGIYTYIPYDVDGNRLEGYEDTTTSEEVLIMLDEAEQANEIKAVLIEVDSFGGSPAGAEEIANAIKNIEKPVVAFIREAGLSAGYFSISPADYIFALKSSDVGSIGVTQSYVDYVDKNQKEGISFVQLSAGKFKDAGNPDKTLTQEEKNLFMRDVKIIYENFIKTISENRNIPIDKVRAIADGSSVLGEQAKELGLIDQIGDYKDAKIYLGEKIGEPVSICW